MKIIFIDWNSFCNNDVVEALEILGHRVKKASAVKEDLYVSTEHIEKLIKPMGKADDYDAIFSMSYFPYLSEYCKDKNLKYIAWVYDNPYMNVYSYTILNSCNYVFLFDYHMYEELHNAGIKTVYYMPMAVNASRLDRLFKNNKEHHKYKSEISFVGSLYSQGKNNLYERIEKLDAYTKGYLEAIINIQLKLYGVNIIKEALTKDILTRMEKVFPMDPNATTAMKQEDIYADYVIARKVTAIERREILETLAGKHEVTLYTGEKDIPIKGVKKGGYLEYYNRMPMVFHNSKINLNITLKSIREGIPLRVWDILGAGGFLITNYQSELMDFFEPDQDIVIYNDMQDLYEKVEFYLKNEEARKTIALNGYNKVKESHGFVQRVGMIMDIVQQ